MSSRKCLKSVVVSLLVMGSLGASAATAATVANTAKWPPAQLSSFASAAPAWDVLGELRDLVMRLGTAFRLHTPARTGAPRPPVKALCENVAGMDPNGMCK
jgi:hypothetical protein